MAYVPNDSVSSSDPVSSVGGGAATGAMIGGPWGAVAGAGLGTISYLMAQEKARKAREREYVRELTSPWTGIHGKDTEEPEVIPMLISGAVSGQQFVQGMNADKTRGSIAELEAAKLKAEADKYRAEAAAASAPSQQRIVTKPTMSSRRQPGPWSDVYVPYRSGSYGY